MIGNDQSVKKIMAATRCLSPTMIEWQSIKRFWYSVSKLLIVAINLVRWKFEESYSYSYYEQMENTAEYALINNKSFTN